MTTKDKRKLKYETREELLAQFKEKKFDVTMQILIENALKDNIITLEKPLQMKFSSGANQSLSVVNNLACEKSKWSGKDVLDTIKERYEMLGAEGIKIEKTRMECKVTLPLLN